MKYLIAIISLWLMAGSRATAQTALSGDGGGNLPPLVAVQPVATDKPQQSISFPFNEGVGHGDQISVAVTIGKKEHLFIVDTGAAHSTIDNALVAANPALFQPFRADAKATAASGAEVTIGKCIARPLVIAGNPLRDSSVIMDTLDLTRMRESAGKPIEGILGMDILGNYVLHLDFVQRKVEFIEPDTFQPPAAKSLVVVPLDSSRWDCPAATLAFAGQQNLQFLLDTGSTMGFCIDEAVRNMAGSYAMGRVTQMADAAGIYFSRDMLISQKCSLAGVDYQNVWANATGQNLIGLQVLGNYEVYFDFSGRRVFLRPIRNAAEPGKKSFDFDWLIRRKQVLINFVGADSLKDGLHKNDELTAVDGKPVKGLQMWQIFGLVNKSDSPVLSIRRGKATLKVTVQRPTEP